MKRLFRVLKELNNYFFLLRTINKVKNSKEWKGQKYQLRTNWVGTIYTIMNLPPEVFNSEPVYERNYIIEETKPINNYLASLNLTEILRLGVKKINREDTEAYLVTYKPLFNNFSFWWLGRWAFIIWLLFWLQEKFDYISYIVSFYQWIEGLILPYIK